MKKRNNIIRKTALITLIITLFIFVVPYRSNAGIGLSVITKPFSSFIMRSIDSVNAILATLFATDAKITQAELDKEEVKTAFGDTSDGVFQAINNGLDEMQDAMYNILLSPDDIFSNKVQVVNANIFSAEFDKDGKMGVNDFNIFNHLMKNLKVAVSGLYYSMRNLAIVLLLCLLIYSGIRIVIASNSANEKAKWKTYMYDWIKALALVMFVHLIMIGVFYIAEVITAGISGLENEGQTIVTSIRKNFDSTSPLDAIGIIVYIIMYLYVTYITIVFLIAYFKRLFYIMVMIIVAPIVSVLYAFGQTGKETFNRWFKEFIMGVMVQPFHMLIYGMLFMIPMSAMKNGGIAFGEGAFEFQDGAIDMQIYALLSIAMIRPIEKYMRQIFGFGKTALDNVASFDSGKKTLDSAAKTVVTVAAVAATAGAAAPLAATAPVAAGGATAPVAAGGAANTSSLLTSDSSLLTEASNINADDLILKDLENEFDSGSWSEEDLNAYEELYNGQQQRKANFESMKSQQQIGEQQGNTENINSPQELVLNNPNTTMNGNNSINENEKGVLEGQDLATALLGRIGGAYEGMTDAFFNPGMLEQFENLRQSLHGFTDSLYITNDAPQDWKNTTELNKQYIEGKKQQAINNFMNNPKNIEDAKVLFNLKDKVNKSTGEVTTADQQAKEKLKELSPYAGYGLNSVPTMKILVDRGIPPEKAGAAIRKINGEEGKYQQFVTNQNNIKQMQTIVADKMGKLAEFRSGDTIINQQVNQEVSKIFSEGRPYITSGNAGDSEVLNRLVDLSKKIDSRVVMGGSSGYSKEQFVVKADKIIQNAVQKNIKNIKLPGSENNKEVKALQDTLNEVKNERTNNGNS